VFCRQTLRLPTVVLAPLALLCCTRSREPGIASIAVLPFEDDSAAGLSDGFGEAAPHLLQWQLDGSPDLYVFAAQGPNSAAAQHAGRILYTWYRRGNGGIEAHFTLQNSALRTISVTTFRGDAASVLNSIAYSMGDHVRPFRSSDDASIHVFAQALSARGPGIAQFVQTAFVPEALGLAALLTDSGHAQQAPALLSGAAFAQASPLDSARRSYYLAVAASDPSAQRRALADVVRLAPADPVSRRTLADLQFEARDWKGAEANYSELGRMQPWDGIVFNELGYARMYLRDAAGARQAIAEYAHAAPEQAPNAADSLGEINWDFDDFRTAEQNFLEASRGDIPLLRGNDVLKAAEARLMQGDRPGADQLFQRYASWRAHAGDALTPVHQAQWLYITGRSREAATALAAAAAKLQSDAQAIAFAQLSFWSLLEGRRAEALDLARRAAGVAGTGGVHETALLCAFYASPSASAAEWQARAQRMPDAILGSALELDGHHAEAIGPLSKALAATSPTQDGYLRGMLIRAYVGLAQTSSAAKLTWPMPMPFYAGDPIFDAAWFPRWFNLARKPNRL
jgi:tetratricopeptide (TPR) repeat protein